MLEKKENLSPKMEILLELLGNHPNLTNKDICNKTGYIHEVYISTLKRLLRKRGYLRGPFFWIDYGKICRNRLSQVTFVIMFKRDYGIILNLLKNIDSYLWFYPVFEQSYKIYLASFIASNITKLKRIFDYLKKNNLITYYEYFRQDGLWYQFNPAFQNDASLHPNLDNLLDDVNIPNLAFGKFSGIELSPCDLMLMMYLQVGSCDGNLNRIRNLEYQNRGNFFSYDDVKKSYQKLLEEKIIRPYFNMYPVPVDKCYRFFLLIRSDEFENTRKLLFNFGKNARLQRSLTYWISYTDKKIYGVVQCICDPLFLIKVLRELDTYEAIKEKKFFFLRSYPVNFWASQSITTDYYDYERQTLHYPYKKYLKEIKEIVEKRSE